MKTILEKDFKVVSAGSLEEFQDRMHEALQGLDNPEITFPDGYRLTAFISWATEKRVIETLFEQVEYETGIRCFCGKCPHLERNPDRRQQTHTCGRTGESRRSDHRACKTMLQKVLDGELEWR